MTFSPGTLSSFLPTASSSSPPGLPRSGQKPQRRRNAFRSAIASFPFYREYKILYSLLCAWQKEVRAVIGTHRRASLGERSHPKAAVSWGNYRRLRRKKHRGQRRELHRNLKEEQKEKSHIWFCDLIWQKAIKRHRGASILWVGPARNYPRGERARTKIHYCHCTDLQQNPTDLPNMKITALCHLLTTKNARVPEA